MKSRENCTYTTCRWVAAYKKPTWYHRGSIQSCLSLPPKKKSRENCSYTTCRCLSKPSLMASRSGSQGSAGSRAGLDAALSVLYKIHGLQNTTTANHKYYSTKCTAYKKQLLQITDTTLQNARPTKYNSCKSQITLQKHLICYLQYTFLHISKYLSRYLFAIFCFRTLDPW